VTIINKQICLASRPVGVPKDSDFQLIEAPAGEPGKGEVLIETQWASVDPYMRGRMNDTKSYIPPFQIGEPAGGGSVGKIIKTNSDILA